jgi:hypothetical protein
MKVQFCVVDALGFAVSTTLRESHAGYSGWLVSMPARSRGPLLGEGWCCRSSSSCRHLSDQRWSPNTVAELRDMLAIARGELRAARRRPVDAAVVDLSQRRLQDG